MQDHGYEIEVMSSPGPLLDEFGVTHGVRTHGIVMPRAITPAQDAKSVAKMAWAIRKIAPDIVHAHTPKGGLLGMTAAALAKVPARVYHMRGLLTLTATGRRKGLLSAAELTSCELADIVICQSRSLRRVAVDEGLVDPAKAVVLGDGSNGVDSDYFTRSDWKDKGVKIRQGFNIPDNAVVVGFVGRLVGDKGIRELARAWERLREKFQNTHLILVGPFEERDPVDEHTRNVLQKDDRVHMVGFVKETAPYYAAMDILTLPTYREGFPNVPLEAAAMELPVVATHVVGCRDAVENRKTGVLVRVKDPRALEHALARYIAFPALRQLHGQAGRQRVIDYFSPERINQELLSVYESF